MAAKETRLGCIEKKAGKVVAESLIELITQCQYQHLKKMNRHREEEAVELKAAQKAS